MQLGLFDRQRHLRNRRSLRRRASRGLFAGGLAIAFLSVTCLTQAQVTSVNGQIAFTQCDYNTEVGDQTCDILTMNADGGDPTNLTNSPTVSETNPVWSLDGARLAFVSDIGAFNQDIWIMNADGSNPVRVTQQTAWQFGPTWSPGGTQLAFTRQVPGVVMSLQFDIIVINSDGTGELNITNSDFDEFDPAWSPDGGKIAFAGVRFEQTTDPITGDPYTAAQWEIVTVSPDGSAERILSAGERGTPRFQSLEEDRAPAWSPDGSKLVFMSQSVDPCCTPWQIWAVNRDGSGVSLLSDNPDVYDMGPSYSPDGTQILFSSTRDAINGGTDLFTMPAPTHLPLAAPVAAVKSAPRGIGQVAPATAVSRLTTIGNVDDPSWGRDPNAPLDIRSYSLFVSVALEGRRAHGRVKSSPRGIVCRNDCTQKYVPGTVVTLTALPQKGSAFAGWTGACATETPQCVVTMDDVKTVGAKFIWVGRH